MNPSTNCQPKGLIEAEIPQKLRSNFEELEWKARFLRAWHAKMRPGPARKKQTPEP
jgi:hypothetical protein